MNCSKVTKTRARLTPMILFKNYDLTSVNAKVIMHVRTGPVYATNRTQQRYTRETNRAVLLYSAPCLEPHHKQLDLLGRSDRSHRSRIYNRI